MPYEKYTLEDFLLDKEFKDWVINPNSNTQLFWKTWMDSHSEQKETILKARELILSYQFKEVETIPEEEKEAILEGVLTGNGKYNFREYKKSYIVAAVLMFFFVSFICFYKLNKSPEVSDNISMIIKENPPGQKSTVALPDGTRVWLNSDSKITFPDRFIDDRIVKLQGEAYFEVVKNPEKPFKVTSNGVITTALGTSFNISAYDEQQNVKVLLVTGKVSVVRDQKKLAPEDQVFLNPGAMAIYDKYNQTFAKTNAEPGAILWKEGIISFRKADYREIKGMLERWYGIKIETRGLKRHLNYTAEFNNESLQRVLERISFTEKFTFEIDANKVKINFE